MRKGLVLSVMLWAGAGTAQTPLFEPVSVPEHRYLGGWEHFVGGGLAAFDCDDDARPELYAAGGSEPAMLLRNRSTRGHVAFAADTPEALRLTGVTGAYPLDIDGDGITDLVVLRAGANRLLQGQGGCRFAPFDGLRLPGEDRWTTAFSATWEAGQTLPTLAFGNYVDRANPDGPFGACDENELFRPSGGGYGESLPLRPGFCALSMLFTDWGRHGRADLRISNDRHYYVRGGEEQMWAMERLPRLYTGKDGWRSYSLWGMGIASRDVNGDGLPDVYLTSMADQKLQFLARADAPEYVDAPWALGTTSQRPASGGDGRPSTGWHVAFGDVQNDGRDDIFVTKGNVDQMPGSAMDDPNALLVQGADGRFSDQAAPAGLASVHRGRGAVLADFDLDGRLDVAVVNRRAPLEVWRNVTPGAGHWLSLRPRQKGPNADAVGGWIELRAGGQTRLREITVGGGHAGGTLGPQHFGLGEASGAEVRVIWPDGTASGWQRIAADRVLWLDRDGAEFVARPRP